MKCLFIKTVRLRVENSALDYLASHFEISSYIIFHWQTTFASIFFGENTLAYCDGAPKRNEVAFNVSSHDRLKRKTNQRRLSVNSCRDYLPNDLLPKRHFPEDLLKVVITPKNINQKPLKLH
jgi:hypothetical protein